MPYYDYLCPECGKHFEDYKSFSHADDAELCPDCKAEARRVFTTPGVVYHSSGFYVTDHKKESGEKAG